MFQRSTGRYQSRVAVWLAALLLLAATAYGLTQLQQSGWRLAAVQSNSMRPHLQQGDAVAVADVRPADIRVGDIVTYPHPEQAGILVSHRVLAIDSFTGRMLTKGDANATADPPANALTVVGRVEQVIPFAGFGLDALRSWYGLVIVVYLPAALLVAYEITRLVRQYARPAYALHR